MYSLRRLSLKSLAIITIALTVVLLVLQIALSNSLILSASTSNPGSIFSSVTKPSVADGKVQGVSGKLFNGDRVREFSGKLRFQDSSVSSTVMKSSTGAGSSKLWAVCTTIHAPSQAIIDFVKQEDWAIVIVGDEGMAPINLKGTKTVILDVAAQKSMAHDFADLFALLPYKHFGRKNVGYLYAILHGAELIWDFDDDNFMKASSMPAVPDPKTILRVVAATNNNVSAKSDCSAFNPLPFMGGSGEPTPMWPRGFPLNLIRQPCKVDLISDEGKGRSVAIYQSLADNEPDVDAIYRLTRVTPMNFLPVKSTLVIPRGILSPFNAQATLVKKQAFWSLLLPVSVHGRVSDIWRSYFAQRLLWDVGMEIAFTPPMVDQLRNPHNHLADLQAEQDLYLKATALVNYLRQWKGKSSSLVGRIEELAVSLYERDYLGEHDVFLIQEWLSVLLGIGYEFPPLSESSVSLSPLQHVAPECYKMTRVFVTGVTGMIGSHVARALVLKKCHQVYGLVRPRSNLDTLVGILHKITMVMGDVADGPRMTSLMEEIRPDYIYHFAAQAINGISYDIPALTLDVNIVGTMNILEAVKKLGLLKTRILLAGSSTEYGRTADTWKGPIPETAPLDPVSPYGVSKVAMEKLGNQYHMSFGLDIITARFFIQVKLDLPLCQY